MSIASDKSSLETSVTVAPSSAAKVRLLDLLWGGWPPGRQPNAYFAYYAQQCDLFFVEQGELCPISGNVDGHVATHQELADVAMKLIDGSRTKDDIVAELQAPKNSSAAAGSPAYTVVENAVNWAARALTCTEIGTLACAFSSRRPLVWKSGSLQSFLADVFVANSTASVQVRLERNFNARNLERLAGVKIEWTNDLSSHLSLRDDDTKVLVFHHAKFLDNIKHDIFPPNLCEETLRTLALLLPASDRDTQRWFQKQKSAHNLDGEAIRCRKLRADDRQIEAFCFWGERLSILKQVFDEAEPKTLSQWWHDRRKGPQWYTFWVAIAVLVLTVFFGVVQSIEGALQVYKAYHPS
ncbi:unnamed protein product [Zymoseptoria tritici ST99CH_1E4]|uniref:Uncharacterized protein n=1 Tax=Zymoseptoria tritici ST99CH_1E4 TaxID=1276532 RepID=A0A2H1GML4_ZYMTR|nr:unnamed protein product [Zymoseptoria tritici ST99CH_1E4]